MSSGLPRVVLDANVMVDLFTGADIAHAKNAKLLIDGHDDIHQIVLPAVVLTEVAGTGEIRGSHLPRAVREERVAKAMAWIMESHFIVVEVSERLARIAAQLAVEHQLKGPDAIILATAVEWKCDRLYTRDEGILKCDKSIGKLRVVKPDYAPPPPLKLSDNNWGRSEESPF